MSITFTYTVADRSVATAKTDRFSWFWGQDGYVIDKQAGRSIYQMGYIKPQGFGADPVPDDVKQQVKAFFRAIEAENARLKAEREAADRAAIAAAPRMTAERLAKARRYDELMNEGGDGYNPYRDL